MAPTRSLAAALLLTTAWFACAQGKPAPGGAEEAGLLAARHAADGEFPAEGERLSREYVRLHPQSPDGHFLLGYALFREIQVAGTGVAAHRTPHEFAALREQKARESLAEYTAGARYGRPSAFDLKIVALDYVLLADYADADKWLSQSIAWDAGDAQSWYYEGRIKFKEAQNQAAAASFRQALKLSPHYVEAEDNLGLTCQAMGQVAEAAAAFQTAIAWDKEKPTSSDGPWLDLGLLLTQQQRGAEAIPYLSEAVKRAPGDAKAHEALATAYRGAERWQEAARELEQAVKLAPDSAALHFQLGQTYRRTGQAERARAELAVSAALEQSGAKAGEEAAVP